LKTNKQKLRLGGGHGERSGVEKSLLPPSSRDLLKTGHRKEKDFEREWAGSGKVNR